MKERPILFSGPMVQAILEGRKTQTRRVMTIPPVRVEPYDSPNVTIFRQNGAPVKEWYIFDGNTDGLLEYKRPAVNKDPTKRQIEKSTEWLHRYHRGPCKWTVDEVVGLCLYGVPGDRLWVREEMWRWGKWVPNGHTKTGRNKWKFVPVGTSIRYRENKPKSTAKRDGLPAWVYRHARFMPKSLSRITLEITEVRVQRVQEISEEDAIAEGVQSKPVTAEDIADIQISDEAPHIKELARLLGPGQFPARFEFQMLWDSINAKRGYGWDKNLWVWALTFKKVS